MWEAVANITTPLALIAFIVAVVAHVYARRAGERERLVKSAPSVQRGPLVHEIVAGVSVDTTGLSQEQLYALATKKLEQRSKQASLNAKLVTLAVILLAFLAGFAIWQTNNMSSGGRLNAVALTKDDLRCARVWVLLGKYIRGSDKYEQQTFAYADTSRPHSTFPKVDDEVVLTSSRHQVVVDYVKERAAGSGNECALTDEAPWGYRSENAEQFYAGEIHAGTLVSVKRVELMPDAAADPVFVWVKIGPPE